MQADGKTLYRGADPVRLKDYTETQRLKRVRRAKRNIVIIKAQKYTAAHE
jgi:hypothetical protein